MRRPQSLFEQLQGKALAEVQRGSGWFPLQDQPTALEPPWEVFDRQGVNTWDCLCNGWQAGWEPSWLKRTFFRRPIYDGSPLVLPVASVPSRERLRKVVVEPFAEDEERPEKAQQLLTALAALRHPVSFEVLGVGPQARCDKDNAPLDKASGG